ncbi:hypothetical protein TRIUR3_11864 [Triticum urartu]|uniref:Uncharacterized protein n=1 Tax=Triticum urartu TaxID=4572 RepID=M8A5I2_TRIUA|nr:hypothetical protein TRIUR3_11864 [Triticum urartu]
MDNVKDGSRVSYLPIIKEFILRSSYFDSCSVGFEGRACGLPLSGVISEIFAVPSAPRSNRPLKPFRKQYRPRPRPNVKSANKDDKDKAKARKRRRADRDAGAEHGERRSRTEVTVIDTSTDGWKAAKVLVRRGANWKISDRKHSEISETEDLSKGKRRAGLVAKVLRDKKKGKGAALPIIYLSVRRVGVYHPIMDSIHVQVCA